MIDYLILTLLIISIGILIFNKILPPKKDLQLNDLFKKQEESLLSLNNDIQAFKEPMGRLRNFLSGSTSVGSFGEWNLKSIIEDVFSKDQYIENAEIIPESGKFVEFAVILQEGILMPIDAKFPSGLYDNYLQAQKEMNKISIRNTEKEIEKFIKNEAKSIQSKYILEGVTTDHAILYIPSESLFQLVMSLNIKEKIFKDNKILVLGPNTLAAYIVSIQMGFRTLALNQKTSEIIKEFGLFKKEFEKFSNSTSELRKKASAMLKVIDEHETREKQMSRSVERMEKYSDNEN
ncbi:MAG: DNA recombination protein RmuC [Pseudomonadota bacterium]|nr:DNA recombination protein RmuC [Pseudomonadota bacterium]